MILQSEIDQINSAKRLKVLLVILAVLMIAVVVYAVIRVGKEDMVVSEPVLMVPEQETATPPTVEEIQEQLDALSKVPEGLTPPSKPSPEEIQKRLDELSKVSVEPASLQAASDDILKQLDALSKK